METNTHFSQVVVEGTSDELLEDWNLIQAVIIPRRLIHWSSKMIPKVIEAEYVHDYVIHLRFADGTEGDIDLSQELFGEMFEELKDHETFAKFTVHPEFHTLCWPNGADIAPEFLYEKIKITA